MLQPLFHNWEAVRFARRLSQEDLTELAAEIATHAAS